MKGFTLLELLVAMAISVILFAGVIQLLLVADSSVKHTTKLSELQDNGRVVLNILTQDIQAIGDFSAFTGNKFEVNKARLLRDFIGVNEVGLKSPNKDCREIESLNQNNGTFFNVDFNEPFRLLWASHKYIKQKQPILNGCVSSAIEQSDVLQIKRVSNVKHSYDQLSPNDLIPSRFYMAMSENEVIMFAGNDEIPKFLNDPLSSGFVSEYQHHVYFIENEKRYIGSGSNRYVPILKRKYLYKNSKSSRSEGLLKSQSLVEGVERLGFLFAVDTDNDGIANFYASSNDLTEEHWDNVNSKIIAIQIFVLLRSIEPEPLLRKGSVATQYDLGSYIYQEPDNNYLRLLLTKTVNILN